VPPVDRHAVVQRRAPRGQNHVSGDLGGAPRVWSGKRKLADYKKIKKIPGAALAKHSGIIGENDKMKS
jgi:hypothetical protein